jgi:hypothetical protein
MADRQRLLREKVADMLDSPTAQGPFAPMGSGYNIGSLFPGIANGVSVMQSPDDGSGNMLEFWPPGEPGAASAPRPSRIPFDKPGVQLFGDKAKPLDIAGDIVSHYGVKNDPNLKAYYDQFISLMTPQQKAGLREGYERLRKKGEKRSFDQWAQASGLPTAFRGYPFKQWPESYNETFYTPEQRATLDEMMRYIRKRK